MSEVIGPCSLKQEMFLHSQEQADITLFGGGAGSGKTLMGVLDFLQYAEDSAFRGVITRRTTPQLNGPGGPQQKCNELFSKLYPDVKWQEKKSKFIFPSGAEVYLRHFEHESNKDDFQGWEVSKFLVDEGQQYTEDMVVYLMSRMRNPASKCKPHMKITCNPDKNSFLRKWIDWYLLPNGLPDPDKAGKLRYFLRLDNTMHWGDSKHELLDKFGRRGKDGCLLAEDHKQQLKPLTFTFIPATVYDNPVLMEVQPEYVAWLEGLGRVEKERLLYGNWDATEEASGYFKREWLSPLKTSPDDVIKRVRAWDIAGSLPSETLPNPDWTVGVLMAKTRSGKYIIEDVVRFRARFGEVLDKIVATAHDDGKNVLVRLPQEPGQAGKSAVAAQITALAEEGFIARARPTNKSKVLRFQPFASVAEAGVVYYVEAPWNDDYFKELELFDGSRKNKDDQVDSTSDAFMELSQGVNLPVFSLPEMKQENQFTR